MSREVALLGWRTRIDSSNASPTSLSWADEDLVDSWVADVGGGWSIFFPFASSEATGDCSGWWILNLLTLIHPT